MLSEKVILIAEIGQAHDGSVGILHSLIDAVAATGVDVIKFQTHIAEAESSPFEPFRVPFSYEDRTRYEYWKRMELSQQQWEEIKRHCEQLGVKFLSTPFSVAAVELLEAIGVEWYKVGSGDITNLLLLARIARTGKPVILSSGMSTWQELDQAVSTVREYGGQVEAVMQCTTAYPTPPERVGLNVLMEMKQRYHGVAVGLSDHSGTIYPGLAATVLGARYVEVHVTFDKRMFGPDAPASLTVDELQQLVEGIRFLERAIANPIDKDDIRQFSALREIFGRSLAVKQELAEGHTLRFEDLEAKKPAGYGIPAQDFYRVIGKKLLRRKRQYEFLQWKDLEN